MVIITSRSRANRLKTSTMDFAKKYNLGDPEFGNFYRAQYEPYVDIYQAQLTDWSSVYVKQFNLSGFERLHSFVF